MALELISRVKKKTKLPLCLGFGISSPQHVEQLTSVPGLDGVIVGSAVVEVIEKNLSDRKKMLHELENFVKKMKEAAKKKALVI